jgi:hypothetical protein
VELLGDLAAGLAAADHEHRTVRELGRALVVPRVELEEVAGEGRGAGGAVGALVGAGAEHDGAGGEASGRGLEHEAFVLDRLQRLDVDALAHGRVAAGGVALEVVDDLVAQHEAVGVVAVVAVARERHAPVRRHEAEAVPAVPPRLADPAALEHDVVDARLRELVADGEPGLTGSHHHDLVVVAHGMASATSAR